MTISEAAPFVSSTYRLQLTPGFGFAEATAVVPYLHDLGISHLYLSPILESVVGSTHGYDVVDHSLVRGELGGIVGFGRLVGEARKHGMGIVLDIVPNHMSIADPRNHWWWDVLENGPSAQSAHVFDVDWDSPERKLKNIVLVPVLGDHRGDVIARGEITVKRDDARFLLAYAHHVYPVAPRAVGNILGAATRFSNSTRLAFLADAHTELPSPTALDLASVARRHRDRAELHELLQALVLADASVASAIDKAVDALNHDHAALDVFLDRQNFRLAHWQSAQRDLDYRRFFDIDSLVGLRVEDPRVFEATHALVCELRRRGQVDGVRVDHVDGLSDPAAYLRRLRAALGNTTIYVEKILAPDEALREWPIEGTTGYEFMNELTALFVDPRANEPLTELSRSLVGDDRPFAALADEARLEVLRQTLDADVTRLVGLATDLCEHYPDARDYTRHDLKLAMRAFIAAYPVYRTYVVPSDSEIDPRDRSLIAAAVARAHELAPELDERLFCFLAEIMLLERTGPREAELVRRIQQLTPPALAKGVEDTAFYRDTKLLALDEVGGDPGRFSISLDEFHCRNQQAMTHWPDRMLATSTHDTKRSEDVRARITLIAEDHERFAALAREFFSATAKHRSAGVPDARMVMMLLQTVVGAWPITADRLAAYAEKAAREAKLATSWSRPDTAYEKVLKHFVETLLGDEAVTGPIGAFVERARPFGRAVSLAWALLRGTSPGTPDHYQGNELTRLDLVDPDNRRVVDWAEGRAALAGLAGGLPPLAEDDEGLRKLDLVRRVLRHRRAAPHVFDRQSTYEPLFAEGAGRSHVVAYSRRAPNGDVSVAVAIRLPISFAALAEQTRLQLPPGRFHDVLDADAPVRGGTQGLTALLASSSVALLHARGVDP